MSNLIRDTGKNKSIDNPVNIRNVFQDYFRYWPFFCISVLLTTIITFFYLRYTNPVYSSSMKVLIKDDKESGQLSEETMFADLGVRSNGLNTENEIEILKSSFLMKEVVNNLNLQYKIYKKGNIRNIDL